jgi:general secretion pathway protein B
VSIILEALRKSEKKQKLREVPTIHTDVPSSQQPGYLVPLLLGGLLVVTFAATAWFVWQQYRAPEQGTLAGGESSPVASQPVEQRPMIEPAAAAAEPQAGPVSVEPGPVSVEPGPVSVEPGPVSVEPGPVSIEPGPDSIESGPVSVEPGAVSAEPEAGGVEPELGGVEPVASGVEPVAAAVTKPAENALLSSGTEQDPDSGKSPRARTPMENYQAPAAAAPDEAQSETAATAQSSEGTPRESRATALRPAGQLSSPDSPGAGVVEGPVAATRESRPHEPAPISYWELPDAVRADVPEIKYSVLVYDTDPSQRFVLINGQRLAEGDSVQPGLVVREIRRDGVVFSYRLYRFLVER